jgi:hypothetical protein
VGLLPVKLCYRHDAESREAGGYEHHASDTRYREWHLV